MKEIIKNNSKIIIAFIVGLIFSGVAVYATTYAFAGSDVSFDNTNANLTKQNGDPVTKAQDALEAVNRKLNAEINICQTDLITKECADGYIKKNVTADDYVCGGVEVLVGGSSTITVANHHGGTLSCTSGDTSKATCSVSGTTVTVNGVAVGNTTLTITSAATANNSAASTTYTVTISYPLAATYISSLLTETTPYGKVYTGANPDNYVWFNNEQWRIIGVYTDAINGDMLKIIKATPYTTSQEYNSSPNINAWSGSSIQTYLYNNYNSIISDTTSRGMVFESGKWNVGAAAYNANASTAYNSAIGTPWTGKIGLIASYEYMYGAENDGTCWSQSGTSYSQPGTSSSDRCCQKDWLFSTVTNSGGSDAWTLSPTLDTPNNDLFVTDSGYVSNRPVTVSSAASPVVFLKSTIIITGGNGQSGSTNSYKLG